MAQPKAKRRARASKSSTRSSRRRTGSRAAAKGDSGSQQWSEKNITAFRDLLARGVISPLNLVMITGERIQEVVDEAAVRGRITHADANDLVQGLVQCGRKQTDDVLSDLERLLARGRDEIDETAGSTRKRATRAAISARKKVESATYRARSVGSRRVAPPVSNYEKLTAVDVKKRLKRLSTDELRKLRDYEKRHAKRKSVLEAVDRKLKK